MNFGYAGMTGWLSRWSVKGADGLDEIPPGNMEALALDCGLSEGQLREMIRKGPQAADELKALLARLGLDFEEVQRADNGTARDMVVTCAECREKKACRGHLASAGDGIDIPAYCGNAATIVHVLNDREQA